MTYGSVEAPALRDLLLFQLPIQMASILVDTSVRGLMKDSVPFVF